MIYNRDKTAVSVSGVSGINWHLVAHEKEDTRSFWQRLFGTEQETETGPFLDDGFLMPEWVGYITAEHRELLLEAQDNGVFYQVREMIKEDLSKEAKRKREAEWREKKLLARELYNKHMG